MEPTASPVCAAATSRARAWSRPRAWWIAAIAVAPLACHSGEIAPSSDASAEGDGALGDGATGDAAAADGAASDGAAPLTWWHTCGDPVCQEPPDGGPVDAGACPPLGAPCTQRGQTCGDGAYTCGVVLVCDDHDPTAGGRGCPVSSAKFKDGITYVDDAELRRLHDQTLATRLATYRYRPPVGDPGTTHLGFVVEDQPQSLAVDRGHDRVDLYGYVSMAVATIQVQEKEIASLRAELDRVKKDVAACSKR